MRPKTQPYQLFLAYAGPDAPIATDLYELVHKHVPTFLDLKSLNPEDRFDDAIPRAHGECCATAVLVSKNWIDPLYAQSEVARAIALARKGLHCLVAIWLDTIETESRPYGLESAVGIQLTQLADLKDVADEVIGTVRRWQGHKRHDGSPTPAEIIAHEKLIARIKIEAISDLARELDLQQDDVRTAYGKVIDMHIINVQFRPPWEGNGPLRDI